MEKYLRRTWVEIDLDAIGHNYRLIRKKAGQVPVMCIVKADAYGHGVEHIALEYQRLGAKWLGVSNIEEAMELRRYGIDREILILGYTPPEAAAQLAEYEITQAVFSLGYAESLSQAALSLGCSVKCHIKADTGMGRIGLNCRAQQSISAAADEAEKICRLDGLCINGIFTHFAVADDGENGEGFTRAQYSNFIDIISALNKRGISFKYRHCCNSAATLEYPDMHLDLVRPGIILYGLSPSGCMRGKYDLRPVMQLRSVVSMIKKLEAGATVSYGRIFTAERDMVLATVPIGYADGFPRILSGNQELIVRGKRVPIVGRVCMDQLMIDVSDVEGVTEGDTVTIFGKDGDEEITVDELADKLGTINYELVCRMARRVPRIYHRGGCVISQTDYLL
ncbi:MAG: alanine racemase [Ruminococcaceae bacterium]|nr:alanine racemase [Oscillospiraceae bacterium]